MRVTPVVVDPVVTGTTLRTAGPVFFSDVTLGALPTITFAVAPVVGIVFCLVLAAAMVNPLLFSRVLPVITLPIAVEPFCSRPAYVPPEIELLVIVLYGAPLMKRPTSPVPTALFATLSPIELPETTFAVAAWP